MEVPRQTYTSAVTWAAAAGFLTHCATMRTPKNHIFKYHLGISLWLSWLRTRQCHCCGSGLIPGLGISACCGCSQEVLRNNSGMTTQKAKVSLALKAKQTRHTGNTSTPFSFLDLFQVISCNLVISFHSAALSMNRQVLTPTYVCRRWELWQKTILNASEKSPWLCNTLLTDPQTRHMSKKQPEPWKVLLSNKKSRWFVLRKEEDSSDRFFQVTLSTGSQEACFTQAELCSRIWKVLSYLWDSIRLFIILSLEGTLKVVNDFM